MADKLQRLAGAALIAAAAYMAGSGNVATPDQLDGPQRIAHDAAVAAAHLIADEYESAADEAHRLTDVQINERLEERVPAANKAAWMPVLESLQEVNEGEYDADRFAERLRELAEGMRAVR